MRRPYKFLGSSGKAICSSQVTLEQLLYTTAKRFREICENLKNFASKMRLVTEI
jgi:hypothetical protein